MHEVDKTAMAGRVHGGAGAAAALRVAARPRAKRQRQLAGETPAVQEQAHPFGLIAAGLEELVRATVVREVQRLRDDGAIGAGPVTPRVLRIKAGFTPTELALLAGVTRSFVSAVENATVKHPDLSKLNQLARALGNVTTPAEYREAFARQQGLGDRVRGIG